MNTYIEYYMHLHKTKTINILCNKYKRKTIVYAIKCRVNSKFYVGSTMHPAPRFHNHLVTGDGSNTQLQQDMLKYGRDKFIVYILEVLEFPASMSLGNKTELLRKAEQQHINKIPANKLYNLIKSYK